MAKIRFICHLLNPQENKLSQTKETCTFVVLALLIYVFLTKMLHISSFLLLLFALKTVFKPYLCDLNRF